MIIEIKGPPVPWTPSRVVRGKYAFNPRYREKEHAQWQVREQFKGIALSGAVKIFICFYMPIPASTSKKLRQKILAGEVLHTKKPDLDNCCKYAIDCIKGIVILDDNQVCWLHSVKAYSEDPKTLIEVEPLET